MSRPDEHAPRFLQHPLWRYGFLVVILGLFLLPLSNVRSVADLFRGPASPNSAIALMLLTNHVVMTFLTPAQQRRVWVPRLAVLAVCGLYALGYLLGYRVTWF